MIIYSLPATLDCSERELVSLSFYGSRSSSEGNYNPTILIECFTVAFHRHHSSDCTHPSRRRLNGKKSQRVMDVSRKRCDRFESSYLDDSNFVVDLYRIFMAYIVPRMRLRLKLSLDTNNIHMYL